MSGQITGEISSKSDRFLSAVVPMSPGSPARTIKAATTTNNIETPRRRRIVEYGDRYIPIRTHDIVSDFQRLTVPNTPQGKKRKIASLIEEEAQQEEDDRIYRAVLESTMFPYKDTNDDIIRRINSASNSPSKGLLTYRSPSRKHHRSIDTPYRDAYSVSPLTWPAQQLMTSPRKPPRYISKFPYKVLDAPELQDDFYLNLVDWSSTNVLGVGLGTCVIKLCDLGANQNDNVTSVSWMPTGTHIAVGTNNGPVEIWDIQKNKKIRKMTGHDQRVGALAWNGYVVSTGSRDRTIYNRDVRVPNDYTEVLTAHKQEVCGLKWNPEGTQLASGGNDNRLLVWERTQTVPLHKWKHHTAAVKAIAWSPHSHGILSSGGGSQDKHIRFWNTITGEALDSHDTESQVCNLAWSKHANELVSTHGYSQNQIILWSYPSMEQLAVLKGHTLRVLYLSVSPDGQNIVTGAGDETLRFWNVFNNGKKEKKRESKFDIRTQIR
ncbi:4862_t:CDS:2 [Ambispora gerdemannii]|uniref:4862_t:CDS:1 n=1 Tax=Ambispora gerdemannii TaxID=144530 RepID=A0A9N9FNA7_9GLOM|nr:4862_t:CDS:2 [Ambispora gerdemannii]